MQVTAIGVTKVSGSKAGRPYEMARIVILVPAESREGETKAGDPYKVEAAGADTAELDLSLDSFSKFQKLNFPIDLDLLTDSEVRYGRVQSVVVGFSQEGKA